MSSSKSSRVIMGINSDGFFMRDLEDNQGLEEELQLEKEYWGRVCQKARSKAREIITQAQKEAEKIRENAYNDGLKQARAEMETKLLTNKEAYQKRFLKLLDSFQQEKNKLWNDYAQDIQQLISIAVQKIVQVEINEKREEILGQLLADSLEMLDSQRDLSLMVHKEDENLVHELISRAKEEYPERGKWKVKTTQNIKPGGIILENNTNRIDNSLEGRWAMVKEVLDQLNLNGSGEK